jgi:hypothetical protein
VTIAYESSQIRTLAWVSPNRRNTKFGCSSASRVSAFAKALVVDRLEALVTSANLTLHGLQANLELGLRVRGPQAQAIALRFDHLIASGVLHEWMEESR